MRVALAGLGLALMACGSGGGKDAASTPTVPVTLAPAVRDSFTLVLPLSGRLGPVPLGSAVLAAPADAIVGQVAVEVGSRVGRGELIISLDAPELRASAIALRAAAEAATRDASRQEALLADGITSKRQADESAAAAASAEAAAHSAERLLARARVTSPLGGVVQRVLVHPGERIQAGQTLAEVVDPSILDFTAAAPPRVLASLHAGQVVMVSAEGAERAEPGRVRAIAPAVDSLTNAAQVVIRVPNTAGRLRAGAAATALVQAERWSDALVVPETALVVVGDSLAVFVVGTDSLAHARAVVVRARQGGRAAVTGAVQPGDRVVTTGAAGLVDGTRVVAAPERLE
jgi:membrane fusion protein (multidrug efflux system)